MMAWKGKRHNTYKDGYWSGWTEFREGNSAPVSLPKVSIQKQRPLNSNRRKHYISEMMDMLRDWRSTPFENEGPVVAGLRSGMCLEGYGWHESHREASIMVNEVFSNLGVKRPTFEEGQREYSIPPENCSWCGLEVPEELVIGQRKTRFCSSVCARSALQHRDFQARERHDAAYAAALETITREKHHKRECPHCGKGFRPMSPERRFCCLECMFEANRKHQPRACEFCDSTFQPVKAAQRFCSKACLAKSMETIESRTCLHCNEIFRPRYEMEGRGSFCSKECSYAHMRVPKFKKTCECCGTAFMAKMEKAKLCSRACIVKMDKLKRRKRQPNVIYLTPQIFDGWFKRAA